MTDNAYPTRVVRGQGAQDAVTNGAVAAADAAAAASGVRVRLLEDAPQLGQLRALVDRTWNPDPTDPPISSAVLRALAHSGNYTFGAYVGDRLVGGATGFLGSRKDVHELHSHVAVVDQEMRGRNVGFALKLHQRAWALLRGIATITWTFDPLVRRNAYFNLAKLGADAIEYLPSFYGDMSDAINGNDESDRLLASWDLRARRVEACASEVGTEPDLSQSWAAGAVVGLQQDAADRPVAGPLDADVVLIGLPRDIEELRGSDPQAARQWRYAVRGSLAELMAAGGVVQGFSRERGYVVVRSQGASTHNPAGDGSLSNQDSRRSR